MKTRSDKGDNQVKRASCFSTLFISSKDPSVSKTCLINSPAAITSKGKSGKDKLP